MKKYFLSALLLATMANGLSAKMVTATGEESPQKETCQKLKESLPGIYESMNAYYSVLNSKEETCETIELIDFKEMMESQLYGIIVGLNYSMNGEKSEKCDDTFFNKIIKAAIKEKANTAEKLQEMIKNQKGELNPICEG